MRYFSIVLDRMTEFNGKTFTLFCWSHSHLVFNVNLVTNGDAETGPCETSSGVTHPTGWNYNGPITQVSYNNPSYGDLSAVDPGPR